MLVRALAMLLADWRAGQGIRLGRYGWHALALAVILPLIWMPLGLLNGNAPSDVFGDGNAHLFFAFILVVIALLSRGMGAWLRRWLLIACAANAVVTGLMIVVTITNLVPLYEGLRPIVVLDLVMGGSVGYMPNGAYRLYLGSGLYLQVGIALTIWQLLQRPRNPWLWALYALVPGRRDRHVHAGLLARDRARRGDRPRAGRPIDSTARRRSSPEPWSCSWRPPASARS